MMSIITCIKSICSTNVQFKRKITCTVKKVTKVTQNFHLFPTSFQESSAISKVPSNKVLQNFFKRGGKPVAIEMQPFLRQESFEKAQ